jgi:hypothetical protein
MPKNNVNPDHYKVAGRERPGEDIPQAQQKETLGKSRAAVRRESQTRVPPAPAGEQTGSPMRTRKRAVKNQ